MGFTHYYALKPVRGDTIGPRKWKAFTDFVNMAIHCAEGKPTDTAGGYHQDVTVQLCGRNSDHPGRRPIVNDDEVAFNGPGELGCETFWIPRDLHRMVRSWRKDLPRKEQFWDFCKTRRCPYDVVVVACLYYMLDAGLLRYFASDGRRNSMFPDAESVQFDEDIPDLRAGKRLFYEVLDNLGWEPRHKQQRYTKHERKATT